MSEQVQHQLGRIWLTAAAMLRRTSSSLSGLVFAIRSASPRSRRSSERYGSVRCRLAAARWSSAATNCANCCGSSAISASVAAALRAEVEGLPLQAADDDALPDRLTPFAALPQDLGVVDFPKFHVLCAGRHPQARDAAVGANRVGSAGQEQQESAPGLDIATRDESSVPRPGARAGGPPVRPRPRLRGRVSGPRAEGGREHGDLESR